MNILIVTPYGFRPHVRSFPEYVLARALVNLGHQVSAVTYAQAEDPASETVDCNIKAHRLRAYRGLYPALFRVVFSQHWDIIHIFHQRNQLAKWSVLLAKLSKTPVILSEAGLLHDPFLSENRERPLATSPTYSRVVSSLIGAIRSALDGEDTLSSAFKSWLFHIPLYKSDLVLCLSAHNLKLAPGLHLRPGRVQWVSHFFDESLYSPPASPPESIASLTRPIVLFIGQLKLRKGFDVFVKAAPRILQEFPTAQFVLVSGNVANMKALRDLVHQSDCGDRIVLFKEASNLEKDALLSISDVLAMPSRYEGFGVPMVEAFAAGCPVVATDVVAINETIRNGENGLLVTPEDPAALADGILRVLQSQDLRDKLIEGGLQSLQDLRVEKHVGQVMQIYDHLASSGGEEVAA